jgi:DNA (cytosine-5)-methyltransferase 1
MAVSLAELSRVAGQSDFASGYRWSPEGDEVTDQCLAAPVLGIEPIAAVDFDPEAVATYAHNFPKARVFVRDIRGLRANSLDRVIALAQATGAPLVFSACAPCQPFSKQRRSTNVDDDRADLLPHVLRFVRRFSPDAIFLENVPGLESGRGGSRAFDRVVRALRKGGYDVTHRKVEARRYGVGERRARLIVIASKHGQFTFPEATHGPGLLDYRTVRDAIAGFPALAAGEAHTTINGHRAARLSDLNLRRVKATPEGGTRRDWPDALWLDCHRGRETSYTDTYGRLRWDDPAPALTTRCISYSNGRFGHPVQDRAISPREAAAIQTFPDEFVFTGGPTSMARQIGNAVPPRLARVFGEAIRSRLSTDLTIAG